MGFLKLGSPNFILKTIFSVSFLEVPYLLLLESLHARWVYGEINGTEGYRPLVVGLHRGSVTFMKDLRAGSRAGESQFKSSQVMAACELSELG